MIGFFIGLILGIVTATLVTVVIFGEKRYNNTVAIDKLEKIITTFSLVFAILLITSLVIYVSCAIWLLIRMCV